MPNLPPRRMKGTGRIAFLTHRAEIAAEIEAGWPVKASYEARADKVGISYQQFVRYVDMLIRGAAKRPRASPAVTAPPDTDPAPLPVDPTVSPKPAPAPPEGSPANARHDPATPRRGFNHDPLERPGDRKRLLGEE